MKEATGELNMTVITVVAIAAVAAFFYAFIWPAIKNNLNRQTLCSAAYSCTDGANGSRTCKALDKDGQETTVQCQTQDTSAK